LELHLDKTNGLFVLLDEESVFPNGTDDSLGGVELKSCYFETVLSPPAVQKFIKHYLHHDSFVRSKSNDPIFTIKHYAGDVTYDGRSFLEKNRDT